MGTSTRSPRTKTSRSRPPAWPKRIPRDRAVAALELAGLILDQEQDLEPRVEEGDNFETVTLSAEAWGRLVERSRRAVGGLLRVDARPIPERHAVRYLVAAAREALTWVVLCASRDPSTTHHRSIENAKRTALDLNSAIRRFTGEDEIRVGWLKGDPR